MNIFLDDAKASLKEKFAKERERCVDFRLACLEKGHPPPVRHNFKPAHVLTSLGDVLKGDKRDSQGIELRDVKNAKDVKALMNALNGYSRLRYLKVDGSDIKKLDKLELPSLQSLVLTKSAVPDVKVVTDFVARHPRLVNINLKGSPVCQKPDLVSRVLATVPPLLTHFNNTFVTNSDFIKSVQGEKSEKYFFNDVFFDRLMTLKYVYGVDISAKEETLKEQLSKESLKELKDPVFDIKKITVLDLKRCKLRKVDLGGFDNLKTLRLGFNSFSSIKNCGLELLGSSLTELDLSNNQLAKKSTLSVLAFLFSLQKFSLVNNGEFFLRKKKKAADDDDVDSDEEREYRELIIFETKHYYGNNDSFGLITLDGKEISVAERMAALESLSGGLKKKVVGQCAWNYGLLSTYGLFGLTARMEFVTVLDMPKMNLNYCDLSDLIHLQLVDLSHNSLKDLPGLDNLRDLVSLNVAYNPKLNISAIFKAFDVLFSKVHDASSSGYLKLKSLSLANDDSVKNDEKKMKNIVLNTTAVLYYCPELLEIDNETILPEERIMSFHNAFKKTSTSPPVLFDSFSVSTYRFQLYLLLVLSDTDKKQVAWKECHPDFVAGSLKALGDKMKATKELTALNDLGLESDGVNLKPFTSLSVLNLPGNALVSLSALALERACPQLTVLDLSRNSIGEKLSVVAETVNALLKLEVLCLYDNPCMGKKKSASSARSKLLSLIAARLVNTDDSLQVLDTEITVMDRVAAAEKAGVVQKSDMDDLAARLMQDMRMPVGDTLACSTIYFNVCGLAKAPVSRFQNLKVLSLRGNRIADIPSVDGLDTLKQLEFLDLRDNLIKSLEAATAVTKKLLKSLVSVGWAGNKFSSSASYRPKFIRALDELSKTRTHLRFLDSAPILVEEVVSSNMTGSLRPGKSQHAATPRSQIFDMLVLWCLPPSTQPQEATDLDLSNVGALACIELDSFSSLRRLSLRSNSLSDDQLFVESGIAGLNGLEELDVRDNDLVSEARLAHFVAGRKLLKLWVTGNPLCPSETPAFRKSFLNDLYTNDANAALVELNGVPVSRPKKASAAKLTGKTTTKLTGKTTTKQAGGKAKTVAGKTTTRRNSARSSPSHSPRPAHLDKVESLLANMGLSLNDTAACSAQPFLDLSDMDLDALDGDLLARFSGLRHLNLSSNRITAIDAAMLAPLSQLERLDLRDNRLSCLEDALNALRGCSRLQWIMLQGSSADRKLTLNPAEYAPRVKLAIPSLRMVDGFDVSTMSAFSVPMENMSHSAPIAPIDAPLVMGRAAASSSAPMVAIDSMPTVFDFPSLNPRSLTPREGRRKDDGRKAEEDGLRSQTMRPRRIRVSSSSSSSSGGDSPADDYDVPAGEFGIAPIGRRKKSSDDVLAQALAPMRPDPGLADAPSQFVNIVGASSSASLNKAPKKASHARKLSAPQVTSQYVDFSSVTAERNDAPVHSPPSPQKSPDLLPSGPVFIDESSSPAAAPRSHPMPVESEYVDLSMLQRRNN